jgi:hypothetical protein
MEYSEHSNDAAYITIVEGPPPEFSEVNTDWAASLAEGTSRTVIATCETRTMNGEALVERCRQAWQRGCSARLDFPRPDDAGRAEAEIIAARWQLVSEGQKLILWVKLDETQELEEDDLD